MLLWEIDWREPYDAFAPLAGEPYAHLLHGGDRSSTAEWSIIVAFPEAVINADRGEENPFEVLDGVLRSRRASPRDDDVTGLPFASGVVGFIGYEAAQFIEPDLALPRSPYALPEATLGVYDAAALFSRRQRRAFVTGRCEKTATRLKAALGVGAPANAAGDELLPVFGPVSSTMTSDQYVAAVEGVIENILDGDFYQVNLSHRLSVEADQSFSSFALFRNLARASDAFHGAFLQLPKGDVISNSPERFFRIGQNADGRRDIIAEPIKGTRARGGSPEEDQALASALQSDPKDRAENIMIADLLRNDLSRICEDGTICEDAICALMRLANVHHLVSKISGVLRRDISMGEVFAALFPCGSITGAPKIEAMNAIARIERVGRGPYCGAIGYIDDRGGADFSVAIRTIIAEGRRLTIPVGGGITLLSNPYKEYEETIIKARGALKAIGAEGPVSA